MKPLADYLSMQLQRRLRHRSAGARVLLVLLLVLLALLPLALAGVIAYTETVAGARQRSGALATEVVKQVANNIGVEMARLESDSEALVLSDQVQSALADYADANEARRTASGRVLTRALLEHYGALDFLNQKYLLDRDNRIIDAQVFAILGQGVVQFASQAPKLLGRPYWGTYDNAAGQKSMVLLRAIHDKSNDALIGSLFLGMRPSHFSAVFDVSLGAGSAVFVLDADAGKVVIDPLARGIASAAPAAALTAELRRSLQRNARSGVVGYSGGAERGQYLAAYAQVADTRWFVVGAIPLATLASEARSVRDKHVLIGAAALLAALALALVLARAASRPASPAR